MNYVRVMSLGLLLIGPAAELPAQMVSDAGGQVGDGMRQTSWRPSRDNRTTALFRLMGKDTVWNQVGSISMDWQTFHTQGLVKVGDCFFVSAVEVLESTIRNGTVTDALYNFSTDRSEGAGRAWLFKFDVSGQLLGKIELTDGARYHPGGIDYDGADIWVPVSEYRPNSRSNIYRVDPDTLSAELVFSEADHIGGIVHNVHRGTLHGVSWGSRRLYTWKISNRKRGPKVSSPSWTPNSQSYIDYQDCHYQAVEYMLCGGVGSYPTPRGSIAFGGLDLVDLRTARPEHQIPVNLFIDEGAGSNPLLSLSHNAFWLEPRRNGSMRAYFMTESDNQADLIVYDATPWVNR